jgi:hypothetical protein
MGVRDHGSTYFSIESSYVVATCKLSKLIIVSPFDEDYYPDTYLNFHNRNCNDDQLLGVVLQLESGPEPYNFPTPGRPRSVVLSFVGDSDDGSNVATMGTCNLTTTYVETRYRCDDDSCVFAAIRASTMPRLPKEVTWLDGEAWLKGSSQAEEDGPTQSVADRFCEIFINSTLFPTADDDGENLLSPLGRFILAPTSPFRRCPTTLLSPKSGTKCSPDVSCKC